MDTRSARCNGRGGKGLGVLLAASLLGGVCPAYADPATTNTDPSATNPKNLQTWTSSDRFALLGCLTIGLGSGVGGTMAYLGALEKEEKANEFEKGIQEASGKSRPCPGESGCDELARLREDASGSKRGGIAGMVIGGLLIGLVPFVIYWGFQPKEPSVPNFMMKLQPVLGPGQAGLFMTGRF